MHVDCRNQLWVYCAKENHARDLHCFGIGDTQTVSKLWLLAESFHESADLWPAAVYHHWLNAHSMHEGDVLRERSCSIGIACSGQCIATVFNNNCLACKLLDIRQRFNEQCSNTFVRFVHQFAHGYIPTNESPSSSFKPSATFAACTAPPEAPFAKLSRALSTMT